MCRFDGDKKCMILTSRRCMGCRFAQTQDEADAKLQKKYARFRDLPAQTQRYIADKYYFGVMEWQS